MEPSVPPVTIIDDFLPGAHCGLLISVFEQVAESSRSGRVRRTQQRTEIAASAVGAADSAAHDLISAVRQRIAGLITRQFGVEQRMYPEYTLMTSMRAGDRHRRHADRERRRDDGTWEPNHTPYRDYTGLLYLSSADLHFDGGLLCFPELGQEIRPLAGRLVAFACDHRYEHEVTPVTAGARYSLSCWLTSSAVRAEPWTAR